MNQALTAVHSHIYTNLSYDKYKTEEKWILTHDSKVKSLRV